MPRKRKGTLEEQAQRDKFTAMRSFLRRCWQRWPERQAAKDAAKRPYKGENKRLKWEYQCAHCKIWMPWRKKEIMVDHVIPCGSFLCAADYATFIPGLFCDRSNLQVLCKKCHDIKSYEERKK